MVTCDRSRRGGGSVVWAGCGKRCLVVLLLQGLLLLLLFLLPPLHAGGADQSAGRHLGKELRGERVEQ